MKKVLLPLVSLACLLAVSCTRKAVSIEQLILATVSDSLDIVPEALAPEDGVCASASVSLELPQSGLRRKALRNIRRSIISEALGAEFTKMSCTDAAAAYLNAYAQTYQQDAREIAASDGGKAFLHTLNYYRTVSGEFIALFGNMLSYRISSTDYSGGAHGTYADRWLNFRASDGALLQPGQLFTENGRETLDYLLKSELQAAGHMFWNFNSEEGVWLDSNFLFEKDSVHFYYNPYEVDCYAAGPVCVSLPLEVVTPLMDEKKLKLNLENSDE